MNNIEIEKVVALLYEQLLSKYRTSTLTLNGGEFPPSKHIEGGGFSNYGVYFQYHVDVQNHGYEKEGNTRHAAWEKRYVKNIHIIITQAHRVFIAVTDRHFTLREVPVDQWVNTSNHDSCWSSDGLRLIRETIFNGYDHCYGHMPEEHKPAPVSMSMYSNWGASYVGGDAFQFVRVEFQNKDVTGDTYFKRVTKVVPVTFEINIIDQE